MDSDYILVTCIGNVPYVWTGTDMGWVAALFMKDPTEHAKVYRKRAHAETALTIMQRSGKHSNDFMKRAGYVTAEEADDLFWLI